MAKNAMAAVSTLSLKDAQRCFDKERQAFLCDLETLRQQLVKKDQSADRAAAVASAHAIQLKREIAALHSTSAALEAERSKVHDQFTHTSSLLETALDQRQEDQVKIAHMKETLRTVEKKHEETLKLVKKEAAFNVRASQEERHALRARVEHLKGKLESEQKEWQDLHRPLVNELQHCKTRLQLVDKELQDARYRERSSFQLKEKMGGEVTKYKRKVADLSTALQEALHSKSALKAEHSLLMRNMKDKWREVLQNYHHTKEQLQMMQEDYNGLGRSRACFKQQNEEIKHAMKQMQAQHEQIGKVREQKCREIERNCKKISATCSKCLKTSEQNEQDEMIKLDAVRDQTRLEVTRTLELDRWDRYQEVNNKYFDTNKQLLAAIEECELLRKQCKLVTGELQDLQNKEQKATTLLEESQAKVNGLIAQRDQEAEENEGMKKTMQDLVHNISSLTEVTVDQSKKIEELESARLQENERLSNQICCLELDKKSILEDHQQLMSRYEEFVAHYEAKKLEKSERWNEIVEAQVSANLLIEQAHTIDDLLQAKANCATSFPIKSKLSLQGDHITSLDSVPGAVDLGSLPDLVASLRQECGTLRNEIAWLRVRLRDESDDEKYKHEHAGEVKSLQLEIRKLTKKLNEQALTIHELTLEEDEDDNDDEINEEQNVGSSKDQTSSNFEQSASSCTDSCASRIGWSDTDCCTNSPQAYHNESRKEISLSSQPRSLDGKKDLPIHHSFFKVSMLDV